MHFHQPARGNNKTFWYGTIHNNIKFYSLMIHLSYKTFFNKKYSYVQRTESILCFFIVNFQHISHLSLESISWTLNKQILIKTEKLLRVTSLSFEIWPLLCFFVLLLNHKKCLHGNFLLWITFYFSTAEDAVWKTSSYIVLA